MGNSASSDDKSAEKGESSEGNWWECCGARPGKDRTTVRSEIWQAHKTW